MNQLSPGNYRDYKTMSASFQQIGAFSGDAVNLVGGGEPRRLSITSVTHEVLPLLGVNPVLGRVFESSGNDESTVVLSWGCLHDHRRDAGDVLLPQPRRPAVDAVDLPPGGLRRSG
jgi:putative ABC transport system permease protein